MKSKAIILQKIGKQETVHRFAQVSTAWFCEMNLLQVYLFDSTYFLPAFMKVVTLSDR